MHCCTMSTSRRTTTYLGYAQTLNPIVLGSLAVPPLSSSLADLPTEVRPIVGWLRKLLHRTLHRKWEPGWVAAHLPYSDEAVKNGRWWTPVTYMWVVVVERRGGART